MIPGTVLLAGVVGSVAYGLAHEGSDVDRLGCYAEPTVRFHRLHLPTMRELSYVTTAPDATYHEAGKCASLLIKGNPSVTELLWLGSYEIRHPLGDELIALRGSLLSATACRDAYLGFAAGQFGRLENRGDGSFSSDTRKRTSKHARHLWRLCQQGSDLNATGRLTVRLDAVQAALCRDFGERVAAGDLDTAKALLASTEAHFNEYGGTRSALPAEPDEAAAEAWLLRVRREFYDS